LTSDGDTPRVYVGRDREVDHGEVLLALYDDALPRVFGYLRHRCGNRSTAEELASETFLAAVGQIQRGVVDEVTLPWLLGIARHKLLDHWRRTSRPTDSFDPADPPDDPSLLDDPWDDVLDQRRVDVVLHSIGAHHRGALTLRYVDGLAVPQVADTLGRTVHATEALLVRARRAFRDAYERSGS
jgi:RNA polymerase sigma-70 factor, ECF subfamily